MAEEFDPDTACSDGGGDGGDGGAGGDGAGIRSACIDPCIVLPLSCSDHLFQVNCSDGGGGGSYNGGLNQTNVALVGTAAGSAEIVALNAPPSAPTLVAPADLLEIMASAPLLYDWVFNDPDAGQTQSEFALVRRKVAQ